MRAPALVALSAVVAALAAAPALAHGPTVRLSYGKVAPSQIAIHAGQTIHFQNASATPRTFTLKGEGDAFESPPLARGEGWHHTFESPGAFPYQVVEFPDMAGRVVVGPAREGDDEE